MQCEFVVATAGKEVQVKVCVGGNSEQLVGGQTLVLSASEPSRTPHALKVLWGTGQQEPAKWYPGAQPQPETLNPQPSTLKRYDS